MKKFISILLVVLILTFTIAGYSSKSNNYSLGDTVSTNIRSFKLNYAKLCFEGYSSSGTFLPFLVAVPRTENALEAEEDSSVTTAKTGHTYVFVDCTLTNLDRADIEYFFEYFSGTFEFKYKGKSYSVYSGDIVAESYVDNYDRYIYENSDKYSVNTVNLKLKTNESIRFRKLFDIPVEVESLDDYFIVEVTLKNSDDKGEKFRYSITSDSISNSMFDTYYKALENPNCILDKIDSTEPMADEEITNLVNNLTEETPGVFLNTTPSPSLINFDSDEYYEYHYPWRKGLYNNYTGSWEQENYSYTIEDSKISFSKKSMKDYTVKDLGNSWYAFSNEDTTLLINPNFNQ